jgi:8-oxo-dGTP pyrophosphatase MutT (NUDIX family)
MANEDLFYLGIKILIINDKGQILLLRRGSLERAWWDIPGGRMQRGETVAEALQRELYEETGLEIGHRDVQFVGAHLSGGRIPAGETDAGLIFFVHRCKWDTTPQVRLSPEHSDLWWATPKEASKALQSLIPSAFVLAKGIK